VHALNSGSTGLARLLHGVGFNRRIAFLEDEMTHFHGRLAAFRAAFVAVISLVAVALPGRAAFAQSTVYSGQEIIDAGHGFFGTTSGALAQLVERIFANYGQPNGYVLGQEGGGAIVAGLSYGEGTLYTKNAGDFPVYWQGPSIGFDFGAEGARTMMLVYNLPSVDAIYRRFAGVSGSAYVIGGLGMTALESNGMVLVPIRTGVGARLGVNVGYLKLTPSATWNPF
jgi:hypothetical protein